MAGYGVSAAILTPMGCDWNIGFSHAHFSGDRMTSFQQMLAVFLPMIVMSPLVLLHERKLVARVADPGTCPASSAPITPGWFAEYLVAQSGLPTAVVVGSEKNKFDKRKDTVYLSAQVAGRTDGGAFAVAAHEVGHAVRYHGGRPLTIVRSVMNKPFMFAALGLAMLSLFTRVMHITSVFGTAPADILRTKAYLLLSSAAFIASWVVIVMDEWRTSFPTALRMMRASGLFHEEEVAWGRGTLFAAVQTYMLPAAPIPSIIAALLLT